MKRSKFSLSHYKLFSADAGYIVPVACYEALPGDTIQQATSMLVRASPLLSPVMHPVEVKIHHWFVPNRIVWEGWEDFITGGPNGTSLPAFPTIDVTSTVGSLADYLGVPPGNSSDATISALPFRAYAMIYNEFYRDQDLNSPVPFTDANGVDSTTNTDLLRACWEKDYFTSARPFQQKGPAVSVPLSGFSQVTGLGVIAGTNPTVHTYYDAPGAGTNHSITGSAYTSNLRVRASNANTSGATGSGLNSAADVRAEHSYPGSTASIGVSDLRQAMALQRYEEARARYGSRYVEYLRYLGVRSSDARLQRPEYLGGGRQTIQFSEVLQTAPGTGSYNDSVGALKGHGIGALRSNRYRRFFEEHGYVISVAIIRPRAIYADGLHRSFSRRTKEEFWQRELQHIGQQPIRNSEVYALGAVGTNNNTFGWQDRYDEYRSIPSGIAGEFRTILNYWHLARQFATTPALNSDFVTSNPAKRIFASMATNGFYIMANHSIQARRMVSPRGTSFIF